MNCRQCQSRLMAAERVEYPGLQEQAHLAECQACREFQRRLMTLEANVVRVPVPPSDAKARLLQNILQNTGAPVPKPRILPRTTTRQHGSRPGGRWQHAMPWIGGLAAAVVLIACGLWLGNRLSNNGTDGKGVPAEQANNDEPQPKPPAPNPFGNKNNGKGKKDQPTPPVVAADAKPLVAKLMECDVKLAEAETARERVTALAELADVLQQETQMLSKSAPAAELKKLAVLYKQVIDDGLVPRAKDVPMEQRKELFQEIAAQLAKTKREVELLAKTAPRSAEPLRTIAQAAGEGDTQLRRLLEEAAE